MRVNVQLIDAETSNHLWAERFDKPLADLFDMQDEIAARLAGALNTELVAAEARRAEQAPTPNSMDLYFQGPAWLNKGPSPGQYRRERAAFSIARLPPIPTMSTRSWHRRDVDSLEGSMLFVTDPMAAFACGRNKAGQGLVLGPGPCARHMLLGLVAIITKRAAQGIAECEHALALDRNLAIAHAFIGLGKILHRPRRRNRQSHF